VSAEVPAVAESSALPEASSKVKLTTACGLTGAESSPMTGNDSGGAAFVASIVRRMTNRGVWVVFIVFLFLREQAGPLNRDGLVNFNHCSDGI
jgi:hypothetical protein